MTTPLYFDESGYTGRQLMDPLQRHFVLASSRISDETAKALMRQSFPDYRGDEFKFEKIWSRPRSRRRLPEFVRAVGAHAEDLYVWQIDKRFSLLITMLEYLVEPDLYEAGFDWYSGFGYRVSNHFQFGLTHVARKGLYEDTLAAYYAFARKPTDEGLGILAKALVSLSRRAPKDIQPVFNACGLGVANFHHHHDMGTFKDTLEVYVTSMLIDIDFPGIYRPSCVRRGHGVGPIVEPSLAKARRCGGHIRGTRDPMGQSIDRACSGLVIHPRQQTQNPLDLVNLRLDRIGRAWMNPSEARPDEGIGETLGRNRLEILQEP